MQSPNNNVILFVYFLFQTIALLNIYRNPQNSAQSMDGLTCKWKIKSARSWCSDAELLVHLELVQTFI